MDIVSRRIWEVIQNMNVDECIICGFRTREEIEYLQDRVSNLRVLYVTAEKDKRLERYISRARASDVLTEQAFYEQEALQDTFGLFPNYSEYVTDHIDNNNSINAYLDKAEMWLLDDMSKS